MQDRATYLCSLQPTHQHIVHKQQVLAANATCDLSAADNSSSPATQACESRRYGTGLQPVAPAWVIPSYHSTPRAMHTPAHMVTSPSHLHTSPPTRTDSAQVSQHVPHCCLTMDYCLRLACSSSLCCLIVCFCAALLLKSEHHQYSTLSCNNPKYSLDVPSGQNVDDIMDIPSIIFFGQAL